MKRYQPVTAWQFRRPTGYWVRVCDAVRQPSAQLLRGVSARKRDEAPIQENRAAR